MPLTSPPAVQVVAVLPGEDCSNPTQSHPPLPLRRKAAPGTDLPPEKGERLPGSNCTLSAKRQGEAVYPHAREGRAHLFSTFPAVS